MLTVLFPLWQHSPVLTLSLDQMVGWSEFGRTLHGWGWNPDLQGPPSLNHSPLVQLLLQVCRGRLLQKL